MMNNSSANINQGEGEGAVKHAEKGKTPSPAALRMTRSRIALRQVLQSAHVSDAASQHAQGSLASSIFADIKSLQGHPSAQLLFGAVNQIWAKHPWRILIISALQAGDVVLKPIAQRSPIQLIAGAAAIGAALALVRPWRLVTKSALLSALLGR